MKSTFVSALVVAAFAPKALAHYNFEKFIYNGQYTGEYEYIRRMTNSNSPITDQLSNDIRCNQGTFAAAQSTKIHDVIAGVDTVGFTIRDVLGHPGPLFAYLSKSTTADVRDYDGSGDWFKIYELGVDKFATYTSSMTWKSDGFKEYNFKLPLAIPNGQYLLRAEHIAIHGAGTPNGTQHYISCAQINVIGGAGGNPGPTAKLPGMYQPRDPGLWFDVWWPPVTNYAMPGVSIYPPGSGASSSSSTTTTISTTSSTTSAVRTSSTTTTVRTSTTTARPSTTTTTVSTTTIRSTTSAPATTGGVSVPKYGQCGGIGWSGATVCASGSTCSVINPYYSQCL
ncbi:Endoglucanase-4 [Dactylella cylindrospora]|nr:Endoglucanase-4 [Dactylella cylindrospora]